METTKLFIYGAGGHGKVVADIAECCGFEVAGFIDDDPAKGDLNFARYLENHAGTPVALGLGGNRTRAKVYEQLKQAKAPVPALIHPESIIARSARIGEGAVVMAGAVINPDALIERGAIINTACVIEHDNVIGEFAHISPKAALAGDVCVGAFAHVGIGASVIQGIRIGSGGIVGAGSAVIRDVTNNTTVAGVPAKEI